MALPSPLEAFVWGSGGAALTPEQIARQREIADALTAKGIDTSPVGSWAQGAARVADALVGVVKERRASNAEGANAATNSNIVQSLLQGGMSGFPAAPTGAFPAAPSSSTQAGPVSAPEGIADGIRQTAAALGIDPVDLGTAISYETAGTFDPMKKGPTTQWGQHRGLIQFGEPQAAQNGVDWSNPVGSQLGPDGAVAKYLRAAGVKPGMGLLDVYSAINAGGVGKYNASDANNGGAPGTVRDKVEKQMAAHRAKALALLGGGNQVASMDPSIGIAPPADMQNPDPGIAANAPVSNVDPSILASFGTPYDPSQPYDAAADARTKDAANSMIGYAPGDAGATTPAGQRVLAAMMDKQPMGGDNGLPPTAAHGAVARGADGQTYQYAETTGMAGATGPSGWIPVNTAALPPQLQQPVSDPQQQVAQAQDLSQIPVIAGGSADAISPAQVQRGINPAIIEALSNPAASEQTRKIAGMLLGQQMQSQDPAAQLDLKYKQAQIDALQAKPDQIPDSVRALNLRAQQAGLVPGTKEYQQFMISGGSGPQTVVNTGDNTSTFVKKSDEAAAKRMDDIVTAGQSAPQTLSDMQQLVDLGSKIGTGQAAQIKGALGPYAQTLGINIDGLDDIQAYQAITSRLAPQMRAVGSGSSSDRDVALFFQSLPNLRNTQGGNELIANTMKAVAQNKVNAAEIARQAQRGDISWQDADDKISKLPNPYDLFQQFQKETQAKKKTVIDGYTIEPVE